MRRLKGEEVSDGKEAEYELKTYKMGCPKFDEYYRKQFEQIIKSDEEFLEFKRTLLEKLPVTFRVNPGNIGHEKVVEMLKDPKFIESNTIDPAAQHEVYDNDKDADKDILMG